MPDYRIIEGDCGDVMARATPESVDAVVCDPPYGLEFMGKDWDRLGASSTHREDRAAELAEENKRRYIASGVTYGQNTRAMQEWHEAWAREALRVLKPGGHLLAFGGTRTYHRLACAIEDAGFEIRDTIAWMYGSGFPKSLDVSKAIDNAAGATREVVGQAHRATGSGTYDKRPSRPEGLYAGADYDITAPATPDAERWQGWGTALKPAHEPIVVARKPLAGTVAQNCLTHGTGALNVDGCRIGTAGGTTRGINGSNAGKQRNVLHGGNFGIEQIDAGRWPANVVLDPDAAAMLDEQTGERRSAGEYVKGNGTQGDKAGAASIPIDGLTSATYADSGGASRFFYVAKASSAERNAGLDGFEAKVPESSGGNDRGARRVPGGWEYDRKPHPRHNVHPTVKPIELMRWLVRLVTPPDGTVLDPFAGSGTTGCAAALEGFRFIGIEREPEYAAIARARIAWWAEHPDGMELVRRLEHERERKAQAERGQASLFDA